MDRPALIRLNILLALAAVAGGLGAAAIATGAVTDRRCFGAAARDPVSPCADPALRRIVVPAPADAPLEPNAACQVLPREGLLYPCLFGARRPAPEAIALVGDSHASHWRAAVDVVANARSRPAVSLTRAHCPFIRAAAILPEDERLRCDRWNSELLDWLGRHSEMRTVFVSHRSSTRFVTRRGRSNYETQVAGHMAIWRALPATVRHIIVIRDTPRGSVATPGCVQRALVRRRLGAERCARSRPLALRPDPAVAAAARLRSPRVHVVDLTPHFCDRRHCYPVVGGALVHKDGDHITAVFARSLGRFLLRAFDRITGSGSPPELHALRPDEREAAGCLLSERRAALQAGGWHLVDADRLARATGCRLALEQRLVQLRDLGLGGKRNRAGRHRIIRRVLEVQR